MSRVLTAEEIAWVRECRAARDTWAEIAEAGGYSVAEVKAAFRAVATEDGSFRVGGVGRRRSSVPGFTSRPLLALKAGTKSARVLAAVAARPGTTAEIAAKVGMPVVNVSALLCGLRAGKRVENLPARKGLLIWRPVEAAR